ncbi:MAG: tail fiber domain-containing protein [Cyclobacteriaceae bacterium]|nr:tail fiber domain-containing protein [Cyclobacteriaceae bacterium]
MNNIVCKVIKSLFFWLALTNAIAQAPQSFKYQAIARNNADVLIANQQIKVQISIRDLMPTGTVLYREQHTVTTNALGLFTISVGVGTPMGVGEFSNISWGTGDKFIQVQADFTGGSTFSDLGTSQLLSVPYALFADKSNSWGLQGNSGTDDHNFVGTTDNKALYFRVNNQVSGFVYGSATFIGVGAGGPSVLGGRNNDPNTVVGSYAYANAGRGSYNTAIGSHALYLTRDGSNNIGLGYLALEQNVHGSHNIAIGTEAGATQPSLDNTIAIGSYAYVSQSNTIRLGNTDIVKIEGQVPFSSASDQRLKTDIQDSELGLDFILNLRPVQYTMISGNGKTDYGFIAQELQEALGNRNVNMLSKDSDYYHLRYNDLIAPMVKAMQEQQTQIEKMDNLINRLLEDKKNMESRLKKLEASLSSTAAQQ